MELKSSCHEVGPSFDYLGHGAAVGYARGCPYKYACVYVLLRERESARARASEPASERARESGQWRDCARQRESRITLLVALLHGVALIVRVCVCKCMCVCVRVCV